MEHYQTLTRRNTGYVPPAVQHRIRTTHLLVAGCGIGSTFAETAVRLGFEHLTLADGDVVDSHNLNRQAFATADVGRPKVSALADRLRAINPEVKIREVAANLGAANTQELVAAADLVFDTIDFLDLAAIIGLHDTCRSLHKPAITALAVGWGAGCIYFPPDSDWPFRRVFGIADQAAVDDVSYAAAFAPLVQRLADRLDPRVVEVVAQALTVMADGAPCPASQVAPGAAAVGALAATLVVRLLAGEPVTPAPHLLVMDLPTVLAGPGIDLSASPADGRG
ncbi:ThiF family adenylyltransferase [Thioalkalicoccus limnaeus]|uniref:ThiF family adenylyltransferase n=1 Tax=Thioalkalicoccus limnaeus TaxID=120681 RepID=A0ABV4BE27_9GAMM